jgi:hypothetical protein
MHTELLRVRIVAIIFSIVMMLVILSLIRKRQLDVKYSLTWLVAGIFILTCSFSQKLMYFFAGILHIKFPVNLFYLIITVFIIAILLHFSIVATRVEKQITKLAQEFSILKGKDNKKDT